MIVSRGLGNSIIPQRLFNHPENSCFNAVKRKVSSICLRDSKGQKMYI